MLQEKDFIQAAEILGCESEVIKAINDVEAPRGAFDSNGRPSALFEAHIFWKELLKKNIDPHKHLKGNENILSESWNPSLYGKYSGQWDRIQKASLINKEAAYRSASYGAFQILGLNAEELGFKNVFEFVNHLQESEYNHLEVFCKYALKHKLADELKEKKWAEFAKIYNGPDYKKNDYDGKLLRAYNMFKNK